MKKKNRRGVTLAELCIVLAVISIVSTMVVSFSVLVTERSRVSRARLDALNDIRLVESLVEDWIEDGGEITKYSGTPSIESSFFITSGLKNEEGALIFFDGESLNFGDKAIHLETVKSMVFEVIENESNTDTLYICTVTYDTGYEGEKTYTFCVNPYVGETIGGNNK